MDQSPSLDGKSRISDLFSQADRSLALNFIHDPSITGLVSAKQAAVAHASGDIVCYLEDDEILEADYFEAIERGFTQQSDMMGCCGLITNLPPLPAGYMVAFHLFHRGIFRDPRVGVHGRRERRETEHQLVLSDCLSGGLSCWRKEVLEKVAFDVNSGFHLLEDMDYSTRAAEIFGQRFYINPNARLEHRMSPVNREAMESRQRRKLREYVLFYRKRSAKPLASTHLAWLLFGLFLESFSQSIRSRNPKLLSAYFSGILDGFRWPFRGKAN